MKWLQDVDSDLSSHDAGVSGRLQVMTLEEAENVGGGFPWVVAAIAIGCALLLAHD